MMDEVRFSSKNTSIFRSTERNDISYRVLNIAGDLHMSNAIFIKNTVKNYNNSYN